MKGRRSRFFGRKNIGNEVIEENKPLPHLIFPDFKAKCSGLNAPEKMTVCHPEAFSRFVQSEDLSRKEISPKGIRAGKPGNRYR